MDIVDTQTEREQPVERAGSETEKTTEKVQKEEVSFAKKLSAFFEKNFALFLTPLIVLFLYFFVSKVYGVYPFGDKYTAASYDYSAQICPFFEHMFNVFKGKSSLTYSYAIMGGADVTGMFLYTFVSPFNVLFLFAGPGNVVYMSAFVIAFKLATIGFAGAWFSHKLFKNIPQYLCVVIGLLYAFCGYAFVASTFIAWLDLLIYVPFCVGAFCHFVKTDSFWRFSILVACCIYAHFSIASFALFTVFPALIAYGLLCVEKERRHKFIARTCVAIALAVVMALPVLLPALFAFMRSSRGGGLFDNFWIGYDRNTWEFTNKTNNNSVTYMGKFVDCFYCKGSYIIADAAFVSLTIAWFFRNGFKKPIAKFMLVAGVLTLLPVLVDESMLLLNMGSYLSYALRFGFLNAVFFMGGACLCLDELCHKKNCAYDGKPLYEKTQKCEEKDETPIPVSQSSENLLKVKAPAKKFSVREIRIWKGVMIGVGVLAVCVIAALAFVSWFVNSDTPSGDAFYKKYQHVDLVYFLRTLPTDYAHSLGGAELICVPFFVVAAMLLLGGWLISSRRLSVKTLSILLVVVLCVQSVFNCGLLVEGNRSTQHTKLEHYKKVSAVLNEQDDSYYRVRDHGKLYYNDKDQLRYSDMWSACVSFPGGTNSFTVFSSIIDEDNYATRRLFGYQGGAASFKGQYDLGSLYRADFFADCFMGYKYIYVPNNDAKQSDEAIKTKIRFEEEYVDTGYMKKVMVVDENGKTKHLQSGGYHVYENKYVFPLGYRVSGDPYKFVQPSPNVMPTGQTYQGVYRRDNLDALYAFLGGTDTVRGASKKGDGAFNQYIPLKSVKELSEALHEKAADVRVGKNEIVATVTAEQEDEYLFLSFVASKGYTVTVNGKKAALVDNDLNFLMVKLEKGENVVHFEYSSPYVKYAGVGIVTALVILAGAILLIKKTKLLDKCSPVISWAGIALGVALVAFFMVYPTGVFASKVVGWLRLKF